MLLQIRNIFRIFWYYPFNFLQRRYNILYVPSPLTYCCLRFEKWLHWIMTLSREIYRAEHRHSVVTPQNINDLPQTPASIFIPPPHQHQSQSKCRGTLQSSSPKPFLRAGYTRLFNYFWSIKRVSVDIFN